MTVRDGVEAEIEARKVQLGRRLYERFSAFWVAVSDQMRLAACERLERLGVLLAHLAVGG